MKRSGFTLIELAIVLVIIGLIVGGVLFGRDLLEGAEVRRTVAQIEQIETAMNSFKTKYNCLAGDCRNATQLFGAEAACPFTGYRNTTVATTCNGNGNGRILNNPADAATPANNRFTEVHRAWQHLSLATMITGDFTATCGNTAGCNTSANSLVVVANLNAPSSALGGAFCLYHAESYAAVFGQNSSWNFNTETRGNMLVLGASGSNLCRAAAYSPHAARGVDTKIDDGFPRTGLLQGANAEDFTDADLCGIAADNLYAVSDAKTCWLTKALTE